MEVQLEAGQKAPAISLKNQAGEMVSLKDVIGKKVVLFFYPEDDTPTCTIQACNLRDNYASLVQAGIVVLGISPDDVAKHIKFQNKFSLPFPLLADPTMKVIHKYGVWGEKNMYGRTYMGIKRTTFLINEDGKIHTIIKKVISKDHAKQILKWWNL